ncbi:MAG: hypothetical protein AAF552_03910 [Pseudomonadota bacterium]
MNTIMAMLLLAATGPSEMEQSIRESALSEMAVISAEAQRQLAQEMAVEVRLQLKAHFEENVAEALLPIEPQLLAAEPAKKK